MSGYGYTSNYRYQRILERRSVDDRASLFTICCASSLTASYTRDGHYLEALNSSGRALAAGLSEAPEPLLRDVEQSQYQLAKWYGAVRSRRKEFADPLEVRFVVNLYDAIFGATWFPDECERFAAGALCGDAMRAGRVLRRAHRDLEALAAFKQSHAAVCAALRRADG